MDIDYSRLEVFSLEGWIWQMHENQSYLGRLIFRLGRKDEGSLAHCSDDEWNSLRRNILAYEALWARLFSPDRFNYAQLGNIFTQLHVHAVPRYSSSRTWNAMTFTDARWGLNWSPTPPSPLTLSETYDFADFVRSRISHNLQ